MAKTMRASSRTSLTVFPLIAATYFMVAGGPYGLEELVQKAGFSRSIFILLLTPLIWSLPTALMVGELSSAIPEEGGFYAWVTRAMGAFWGFQEAWLSLVASVFDMAIYPTIFVLYLSRLWPAAAVGHNGVIIGVLMITACTLWNLRGAGEVGGASLLMTVALLAPFALMIVYALGQAGHPGMHVVKTSPQTDLFGGIMIAMWNYMGWDNASTVAGEVENPQRTYPLAMMGAVALVAGTYVLPVAAIALTGVDPSQWTTGAWVEVAQSYSRYLGIAVVVGGMICGLGMFNALIMSYSRLPLVLAEDGYLPAVFARTLKSGAPWVAILACALAWTASLGLSFERLITFDVLLYGLSLILEFVALIILRVREPELPRPFRIPGGMIIACLLGVAPALLIVMALFRNRSEQMGSFSALTLGLVLIAAGPVVYFASRLWRRGSKAAAAN
ncbi:MAG: amino acid permease-associated region [Acidobacteriales bacterium]|nr:amino acid permease-associated region [Terriglobales bacterium]